MGLNDLMENFWTPAHQAVELEDVETLARLLDGGSDPDEFFEDMTLLAHAIDVEGDGALQSRRPLTVRTTAVLLAYGADPELAGSDGRTPMDIALGYDHDMAVRLLQRHIGRATEPGEGGTPAARRGRLRSLKPW